MRHAPIESNDTPYRTVHCDMCVSLEPPHAPRTGRVHKENAPPSNNTLRSGADRSTQTHSQHKMHIVCMCLVHAHEHVLSMLCMCMCIVKPSPRWCLVMGRVARPISGGARAPVSLSRRCPNGRLYRILRCARKWAMLLATHSCMPQGWHLRCSQARARPPFMISCCPPLRLRLPDCTNAGAWLRRWNMRSRSARWRSSRRSSTGARAGCEGRGRRATWGT